MIPIGVLTSSQVAPAADMPPITSGLFYGFAADNFVSSDVAGTVPAVDGGTVAHWKNIGVDAAAATAAVQSTSALRPIYHTVGLAGKPYLEGTGTQFFENLPYAVGVGSFVIRPHCVFAVVENVNIASNPFLHGIDGVSLGGKVSVYFRPTADAQVHFNKIGQRHGNVLSPMVLSCNQIDVDARHMITNGVVIATGQVISNADATACTQLNFLHSTALAGSQFKGRIYEYLLYDSMTMTDQQTVHDYLMAKYGII